MKGRPSTPESRAKRERPKLYSEIIEQVKPLFKKYGEDTVGWAVYTYRRNKNKIAEALKAKEAAEKKLEELTQGQSQGQ